MPLTTPTALKVDSIVAKVHVSHVKPADALLPRDPCMEQRGEVPAATGKERRWSETVLPSWQHSPRSQKVFVLVASG